MERSGTSGPSGDRASILCVCTANVCRSPMTELLIRDGLHRRGLATDSLSLGSAGVRARTGDPIAEHAADLLAERGIDAAGFRSRPLTAELVAGADLVLAASREHKSAVIALDPSASRRAFTIREFGFLLEDVREPGVPDDPAERVRELVRAAIGVRGLRQPERPDDFDLDDPYGRRKSAFRKTLALLDETLTLPLDLLAQRSAEPPVVRATRRFSWR